jgi:ribonuclease P protein component
VSRNFPISMRILQADDIGESRVGFIVRKRTGVAPLRNAMRRVLREVFRLRAPSFLRPAWVIFDVSDKAATTPGATRAAFREKAEALVASLCPGAGRSPA